MNKIEMSKNPDYCFAALNKYSGEPDLKAHAAITRQSSTEGMARVTMAGTERRSLAKRIKSLKPVSVRTGVCNPTPRSWIR